jgi:hypothetical protein
MAAVRPQAEENLRMAAWEGDLATLKRLVAEGLNLEAAEYLWFHDHVFGCVASVVRSNVQMVAGSTGR